MTHEDAFSNLPWFITRRMSQPDMAATSLHIAMCATCQQELDAQNTLREAMLTSDNVEFAPQASLQKLQARIAEMERELPQDRSADAVAAPKTRTGLPAAEATPRWLRPLMIGQIAAVLVAASLLLWTTADRWLTPRYQTATRAEPAVPQGLRLRVIVSPQMSVADFSTLIIAEQGRVIGGPNAQSAWTLLLPEPVDDAARAKLYARWHGDARVVFVEPVAGAGAQ